MGNDTEADLAMYRREFPVLAERHRLALAERDEALRAAQIWEETALETQGAREIADAKVARVEKGLTACEESVEYLKQVPEEWDRVLRSFRAALADPEGKS